MAKDSKQCGISFLECILALMLFELFLSFCYPSLMMFLKSQQEKKLIRHLQSSIDWARSMAIIRQEKLILSPLENWQKGWQIVSNDKMIKEVRLGYKYSVSVKWHGFSDFRRLTFYPNMSSNHLNGYFQIGYYQLWINRLGHMRVTYGI